MWKLSNISSGECKPFLESLMSNYWLLDFLMVQFWVVLLNFLAYEKKIFWIGFDLWVSLSLVHVYLNLEAVVQCQYIFVWFCWVGNSFCKFFTFSHQYTPVYWDCNLFLFNFLEGKFFSITSKHLSRKLLHCWSQLNWLTSFGFKIGASQCLSVLCWRDVS